MLNVREVKKEEIWESYRLPCNRLVSEQLRSLRTRLLYPVIEFLDSGVVFGSDLMDGPFPWILGEVYPGYLNLDGTAYRVDFRVCRLVKKWITCEFLLATDALREKLSYFLEPDFLGTQLRLMPFVKVGESSELWLSGPGLTRMCIRPSRTENWVDWSVFVLGYWVDWKAETGFTTGTLKPEGCDQPLDGLTWIRWYGVQRDQEADPEKLWVAKKLILSSNLSKVLKKKRGGAQVL